MERAVRRLTGAACGMHLADQLALVAVPLIAALVFDAGAHVIGILVACQSLAHLVGSLPFGILVDNAQQRTLTIAATAISIAGFAGASLAIWTGSLVWFGIAVTLGGFGVVLFVLTALSILPRAVPANRLAAANAAIEIPRAAASFAVPLVIGVTISSAVAGWVFPMAVLGACAALAMTLALPRFPKLERPKTGAIRRVLEGGRFVLRHPLLLAISLCALFWNVAFAALLVVMVPLVTEVYRVDPGSFGIALSAFGLAAIAGSWLAGRSLRWLTPNAILLFGPGSSVLAMLALFAIPEGGPEILIYASFFLLGFGPAMWLVAQNSVRQLVTPATMLGRVNAVIQTAIYGVRPIGALIGGAITGTVSPSAGLGFVVVAYALSFLAAALSDLRKVRGYADLRAAGAA